jgi:hypothetical protein
MPSMLLRLLCCLLLLPWAAAAQDLPPPGGWPLRTVAVLRVVPEPLGGLIPYRQGQLWGFADTTGRVWIRPVFTTQPPRFGAGLLLQAQQERADLENDTRPPGAKHARGRQLLPSWNVRYGRLENHGLSTLWSVDLDKPVRQGTAWLLNAHGERLPAQPNEAMVQAPGEGWRAVRRGAAPGAARELVAIETRELGTDWQRPGRVFTVERGQQAPAVPVRFTRPRAYEPDIDFTDAFATDAPLYLARKVNWLQPLRLVLRHGRCGDSRLVKVPRYRHRGQVALFDERGHRLTPYRYDGGKRLLPQRLAYWHCTDDQFTDEYAADTSGLPQRWNIVESINGPARRYGLLDRYGRELTPPLYARIQAVGPNSLWVMAVRQGRVLYGLVDTLGCYQLPLSPRPLSLPDAAGLLRRRSSAPLFLDDKSFSGFTEAQYADTVTTQYLRPDGRLAFAGRFRQADAFWQGRALVQQGDGYGLLDTLGRWVLAPQPDKLMHYAYATAHYDQCEKTDPLRLFDHLDGKTGDRASSYNGIWPGDPPLLLAHGPQGYGLRDARTGQVVVPPTFDKWPEQWYGGVVGERRGQPLGYSYLSQVFSPNDPASYPTGVRNPVSVGYEQPPLQQTKDGWLTRGGRQLWQD